jgi:hypothetical protein
MRFMAAQLEAYLRDDLWLGNATHANAMAAALARGLTAVPGVVMRQHPEANILFCRLPIPVIRGLLEERLRDIDDRAARYMLTDVRVTGAALKISPLQAVTPDAAERLADHVHAVIPRVRITELLAEVSRWTGLADCLTHLRTGLPAEDERVILTAVLADATNLGLTRMAEACSVASYRQLAWTAGWHLSEEGYSRALAGIVAAQQTHPLSARFGSAVVSSSDG